MKKINLSKETLRVLTAQEVEAVAGGNVPGGGTSVNVACQPISRDTCVRTACGGCPTTTTTTTTVQTAPNATCVPQTRQAGGRLCEAEPYSAGHGCDPNL